MGRGRESRSKAKSQATGPKLELGPIQEIKPFRIYLKFRFLANFGNLYKKI
jgi:hypothetical protein